MLLAILLPIATKNGYFVSNPRGGLVGIPALIIGMMIVYACIPLMIGRMYFQVVTYVKPGNECLAHSLLAVGLSIGRLGTLWMYQLGHWWYVTHILNAICLLTLVVAYLVVDWRRHVMDVALLGSKKPIPSAPKFTMIDHLSSTAWDGLQQDARDGIRAPVSSPRHMEDGIPVPSAPILDFPKYCERQDSIATTVVVFSPVASRV
jgi:hypothetical protein